MLIVRRKIGERIVIAGGIEIVVSTSSARGARIGIVAPPGVLVLRGEVHDAICGANAAAVHDSTGPHPGGLQEPKNHPGDQTMIAIENTRFGNVEIDEQTIIDFPAGIIGFPNATRFALLERAVGGNVAYLQSLDSPELALPVMDSAIGGADYPPANSNDLARQAGLDPADMVALVVVAATAEESNLSANLLAPILIDARNRRAAQVVLDPRRFSAWCPISPEDMVVPADMA